MWDEQFETTIRGVLPFLAPGEEIREDTDLMEAGLDSMGVVDLLGRLETAYGVHFRDDALSLDTFATPGSLWKTLESLR